MFLVSRHFATSSVDVGRSPTVKMTHTDVVSNTDEERFLSPFKGFAVLHILTNVLQIAYYVYTQLSTLETHGYILYYYVF